MTVQELENILAKEKGGRKSLLNLMIHKMDGESALTIQVPSNRVTLSSIRSRIYNSYHKTERINWRYVWSSYCLAFNNRYMLVNNMNLDLKQIGLKDYSELTFKKILRRRRKNGPIRLRDNEKDKFVIV